MPFDGGKNILQKIKWHSIAKNKNSKKISTTFSRKKKSMASDEETKIIQQHSMAKNKSMAFNKIQQRKRKFNSIRRKKKLTGLKGEKKMKKQKFRHQIK